MTGQLAPQVILDLLSCNYTKKCELPRCICVAKRTLKWQMYRLQDCDNQADLADDEDVR